MEYMNLNKYTELQHKKYMKKINAIIVIHVFSKKLFKIIVYIFQKLCYTVSTFQKLMSKRER